MTTTPTTTTTTTTSSSSSPTDPTSATTTTTPQHNPFTTDKSFAETLLHDAFNPGVHPQSLDATNYVLIALFICSIAALVAWNYSIHFIVILGLGAGLAILMNTNRGSILEASAEFLRQNEEKMAKMEIDKINNQKKQNGGDGNDDDDDDEDEDYEIDGETVFDDNNNNNNNNKPKDSVVVDEGLKQRTR
jgi:hypothetical protein